MSFTPENPLEEALLRANKSAMARREFQRLVLHSDLVVVGRIEGRAGPSENTKLQPGEKLQIGFSELDGHKYIPAFTSLTRLQNHVQRTVNYLQINGRDLFEMTRGATLYLNLSAEHGMEFSPDEIAGLLDSKDPYFQRTTLH